MAKKALDSISKNAPAQNPEPVVETVSPHTTKPVGNTVTTAVSSPTSPEASVVTPTATEAAASTEVTAEASPEKTEKFDSLFPEPSIAISAPPSWIWWLVLLLISILLAGVGYAMTRNKINSWISVATPTPTAVATTSVPTITPTTTSTPATPTSSPSATPSPINTNFSVRVLNGTTTTGLAAQVESILKKAGYSVRTIGNAQSQNYASTIIYYQAGKLSAAQAIQKALPQYSITLEQSTLASPDAVLVIIGKKII